MIVYGVYFLIKGNEMKTGWIFRMKNVNRGTYSTAYAGYGATIPTSNKLRDAIVVGSRRIARKDKDEHETILQVTLTRRGFPKKILSRG